ncbi:MAG: methanogenesis marker 3 protein [Methanobrevibacter sp.]|jgi:putative methanogenesis marker protein 3|nr:methanogenesis marker 3 protein [Candidatus Methanoflexus mossambicus]
MFIYINGDKFEISKDATVKDAIEISKAPYSKGSIISLIKGSKEFKKNINKYKIKTSKGSIIIEVDENESISHIADVFKDKYDEFANSHIRWTSSNEIAIGPVITDLKPNKDEHKFKQWDVILSLSGFSNESTHIMIFKEDTKGIYGILESIDGKNNGNNTLNNKNSYNGVFAHVIGGKRTLKVLTDDDEILAIEPIIERSSVLDVASISNLDTVLEEGNQLFTYVLVEPNPESPKSVEHLFSLIDGDTLKVDYESNSFLGFYDLQGLKKEQEELKLRKRGAVTLRNTGNGVGKVYFYREDRVISNSHTHIGNVIKGMELIDMAKKDDLITIKTYPDRILTLDLSQSEANDLLNARKIKQIRNGVVDDNGLIVSQNPQHTMDIIAKGEVETFAINKEDLALVEFDNDSPRSVYYFKKITDLLERPIGKLEVHFAFEGMKLAIFKGDDKEAKGLVPEKIPKDMVEAGTIALTNMSRKNVGLIGVRFEDNEEYGPTAEPFTGTNILGKFKSDLKPLENLKENDILFIKEFKS